MPQPFRTDKVQKRQPTDPSKELEELLIKAAGVFGDYVKKSTDQNTRVVDACSVQELLSKIDLSLNYQGVGQKEIWQDIKTICETATNTWNEKFLYKLYSSPTPIGVVSESLLGLLNNNVHVFQSSPIGAILEATISNRLAEMCNFPKDTASGLTFPGGSYSNLHALMVARNQRFPEIKAQGLWGLAKSGIRPVVFTSAHAHYSIEKSAIAAGIGLENVVSVPTDNRGCMDADALRLLVIREIQSGGTPFFVNATAGTTVLSAFDPLDPIAAVCQEFDMWLHLDGSWGGPLALFGDKSLFEYQIPTGKVNSFTINPHKLLGIPMQCSFLLVRDGLQVMRDALGLGATYLYHSTTDFHRQDEDRDLNSRYMQQLGGSWDLGDATMGCGRRPDAIKMWISWRYYGTQYFCDRVNRARQLAIDFARLIVARGSTDNGIWKLLIEPQSISVCFWFIPHSQTLRYGRTAANEYNKQEDEDEDEGEDEEEEEEEEYAEWWGDVTKTLCNQVNSQGNALVDYATVERFRAVSQSPVVFARYNVPYFFRIPFNNPNVTLDTQNAVLDAIEEASRIIYNE
ncbi:Glutamate decarboxylase 2 [Coemansia asiatica]|uniref:Glutamate decarboxylase 2 n=1 Tax=Coemansia asiatica TaxID=1052880 RepID=A0A9W7XHZ1_9FUNG|nr:Glutamate decarboxylase 2 [Coemansia asiatica]